MNYLRICFTVMVVLTTALSMHAMASGGVSVVVLANSIDSVLASDFFDHLVVKSIDVLLVNASEFEVLSSEKYIIVLGGHNAPEGVGGIVSPLLSEGDKNLLLSSDSARTLFVREDVWTQDQVVWIIAGFEAEQTRLAAIEHDAEISVYLSSFIQTSTLPLNTCDSFCQGLGYGGGVCRLSPAKCRIEGDGEVYRSRGDRFCRYRMGHKDTCCCKI